MSVFDITNRCNLKCIYCCRGESLNKQVDEVSTEDVLNTIKQIVDIRGNFIVLQGGEPLIRKDIVDILSKMKEYKKVIPAKYFNDLKNLLKLQLPRIPLRLTFRQFHPNMMGLRQEYMPLQEML